MQYKISIREAPLFNGFNQIRKETDKHSSDNTDKPMHRQMYSPKIIFKLNVNIAQLTLQTQTIRISVEILFYLICTLFIIAETQKRRRFHPLRNLRKIFRRRSVAQADTISPTSSLDDPSVGRLSTSRAIETSPDGTHKSQQHHHHQHGPHLITSSVSAGGGFFVTKEKREHSADSARAKVVADELDKDMTDYQRSLSEGRLLDR